MKTSPFFLALLATLSGCIIYDDTDCRGKHCEDADGLNDTTQTGNGGHNPVDDGVDDTGTPTEEPADIEVVFSFEPGQVEVGTGVFGSLRADQDFDFSTISTLSFYGDAKLDVWEARDGEVLMAVTVPADAEIGSRPDLLIEFVSGEVELLEDVFEIVEVGGIVEDPDTDTDTGTSGGTDDTGDTTTDPCE